MGDTIWLAFQALGTMGIALVVAYFSWRQTRRMLDRRRPQAPSAMARAAADPQFRPDPEVTDPYHVAPTHAEPGRDGRPAQRADREAERLADQARAASTIHPSAVERLDGLAGSPDEARRG